MENNKTMPYVIMFAVVGVMAIASAIISTVAYDSFAYFEVFYFVCIAASIVMLLTWGRAKYHFAASIAIITLGFLVNSLIWSLYTDGTAEVLNLILTVLILGSAAAFVHAYLNANNLKRISLICSALTAIMIVVVAIYNLATKVSGDNDALWNACFIIQNLSLMSTILIPFSQYLFLKNRPEA